MKQIRNSLSLLFVFALVLTCCVGCGAEKAPASNDVTLTPVYDYVFDAGTYTALDYDFADAYFAEEYDNYAGGCTAVAKVNEAGDTIIGRNMDLNISNKAAYIMRTDVEGCYKTLGLAYTFRDISPDYAEVRENGLPDTFAKVLPFMADDVLNEKGLYIEINMRFGEFWPTGDSKFSCPGTNPDSDTRVYMFQLPRYIGEHCATVEEAVEYAKTLNVYSKDGYWNYCFLIADATGHYGVLEFGANQMIWLDGQQAQANFYLSEELAEIQELKCGVGRYDKVMAGIDAVQTREDMFALMDSVSYFQFYDPENCQFDYRSENMGAVPFATYDILMEEENRPLIDEALLEIHDYVSTLSRQELQNANEYWESAFTEVVNCNERSLFVRFFEDEAKTLTLTFDE